MLLQSCEAHKSSSGFTSRARIYSRHSPTITYNSDNEDQYYNSKDNSRKRNYPIKSYEEYDLLSDNLYAAEEVIVENKGNDKRKDSRLKEKKSKTIINSYNKDKNHRKYYENNAYSEHRSLRNKSHIYMNGKIYSFTKNKTKRSFEHRGTVNSKYYILKNNKGHSPCLGYTHDRIVAYKSHHSSYHNQKIRTISSAFINSIKVLKSNIPSPKKLKHTAVTSFSAAREKTSQLSTSLYREAKGLASSELEMVLLKATRPDNTPVKSKHVERLVGITYQISSRYDIYDAVLRKLWNKMVEEDWRTVIKSLYVLHRFSVDGCLEHGKGLKGRIRELKHKRDVKRGRRGMYFARGLILKLDGKGDSNKYKNFLSKYTRYVLLRSQCFSGMFSELDHTQFSLFSKLANVDQKSSLQSDTTFTNCSMSTCLNQDNLDTTKLLLTAGVACTPLSSDKCCEHIAVSLESVITDLMGLVRVVGHMLNAALEEDHTNMNKMSRILLGRWCDFYSQLLLPRIRQTIRTIMPLLNGYGLYLPSDIDVGIRNELLEEGLRLNNFQNNDMEKNSDYECNSKKINNYFFEDEKNHKQNEHELIEENDEKYEESGNRQIYDLEYNNTESGKDYNYEEECY